MIKVGKVLLLVLGLFSVYGTAADTKVEKISNYVLVKKHSDVTFGEIANSLGRKFSVRIGKIKNFAISYKIAIAHDQCNELLKNKQFEVLHDHVTYQVRFTASSTNDNSLIAWVLSERLPETEYQNLAGLLHKSLEKASSVEFEARWVSAPFPKTRYASNLYNQGIKSIVVDKGNSKISLDVQIFPLEWQMFVDNIIIEPLQSSEPKAIPTEEQIPKIFEKKNPVFIQTTNISDEQQLLNILCSRWFSVKEEDVFKCITNDGTYVINLSDDDYKRSQEMGKMESFSQEGFSSFYSIIFKQ